MPTSGEDLPSEATPHILFCLTQVPMSLDFSAQLRKRQLGILTLVCRYWAKRVRPHIFNTILIASQTGLEQLLEFPDCDSFVIPSISECFHVLRVLQTGPWAAPWLHHIQSELGRSQHAKYNANASGRPAIIELEHNSIAYSQSDVAGEYYAPSTFAALLTLPSSCFPLQTLELHFVT